MKLSPVFVDGQEGVALFTAQSFIWTDLRGVGPTARRLEVAYEDVDMLLVAKKMPVNVKITFGKAKTTHMLRFASKEDAASAVDVISGKIAPAPGAESAAAAARSDTALVQICSSLVDDGLVGHDVVDEALAKFRGVLHVFEAINELVDSKTLQLRPVTDQLLSDIFHQLPLLAHLYAKRVHSVEEKVLFVESIVKKYFCYKLTSLDEIGMDEATAGESLAPAVGILAEEPEKAATKIDDGRAAISAHLSFLNSSSANALLGPTVTQGGAVEGFNDFSPSDDMFADVQTSVGGKRGAPLSWRRDRKAPVAVLAKRSRSSDAPPRGEESHLLEVVVPMTVSSIPNALISRMTQTDWKPKSSGFVALKRFWNSPLTEVCPCTPSDACADEVFRRCVAHAREYDELLFLRGKKAAVPS